MDQNIWDVISNKYLYHSHGSKVAHSSWVKRWLTTRKENMMTNRHHWILARFSQLRRIARTNRILFNRSPRILASQ